MGRAEMSEREQVRLFQIQDELVADRVMDERTAATYAETCIQRARDYEAKLASMTIPLYLTVWAKEMATRHGKTEIKAHHNYLPWMAAFFVSRYGEAAEHWPDTVTDRDIQRARDWKTKGLPPSFRA